MPSQLQRHDDLELQSHIVHKLNGKPCTSVKGYRNVDPERPLLRGELIVGECYECGQTVPIVDQNG